MSLTEKQRKIITKKRLKQFKKEGLTYRQIAKKVKMKTSTIYYYYHKFDLTNKQLKND